MESILFQDVLIVDHDSAWNGKKADVLVENGIIRKIAAPQTLAQLRSNREDLEKTKSTAPTQTVNGGCLSPGWVDMRCGLTDPGYEWKEDLSSLADAALAGGFTRILTQPNSLPVIDNAGQVRALLQRASTLPLHVHVTGAISVGLQGKDLAELYDMRLAGAIAFSDGRKGTQSAGLLLRALQYSFPFGGLVMDAPLDQLLAEDCMVAEGISAVRMGLKGIPAIAEQVAIDRDLRLLEHFPDGRLHLGPITTLEGITLVRKAKAIDVRFTAETSALYLLLDAEENEGFDAVTKVFPPLRDRMAVMALRMAVADGTIDVVSSGHHPQGREEKTHDFVDASFGADTLETAFAAIVTGMQTIDHDLSTVIATLSSRPREILGLPNGAIKEGGDAELTHFDPHQAWTPQLADIRSKCKYNPLIGKELQGKVLGTYVKGQFRKTS
jgi:dihydroorotase